MTEADVDLRRDGALDGVVVIELAGTLAAEFAGGVLGDMGATVIKVEPPDGSPLRRRERALPGEDSLYVLAGPSYAESRATGSQPGGVAKA